MLTILVVAAVVILALITRAGVLVLQRIHPAQGRIIEVAGARLNVLDIGPRDGVGPPVVIIHGASSNLEVMRQPLGERLAKKHRVILIDRPGHGWSTRVRLADSTPAIQGRMIDEALQKLGGARIVLATATNAQAMANTLGGLSIDGRLVVLGADATPMQVNAIRMIGTRTGLYAWPSGSSLDSEDTMKFSARTRVRPMTEEYPLEKAAEAYARMMSNKARFRVVLTTGN